MADLLRRNSADLPSRIGGTPVGFIVFRATGHKMKLNPAYASNTLPLTKLREKVRLGAKTGGISP
jgi:hypothetical protein